MAVDLRLGDCLEVMRGMPDASVDAVVTDPPAGISFMGKTWDKPGTLGVSGGKAMPATTSSRNPSCKTCGGRMRHGPATKGCSCDAPDWNDREYLHKDRAAFVGFLSSVLAECLRVAKPGAHALIWALPRTSHWTGTAIEDAGWRIDDRIAHHFGTGFPKHKSKLKPATEDWWLCTKPGGERWLNVDGCRVAALDGVPRFTKRGEETVNSFGDGVNGSNRTGEIDSTTGRWPTNLVLTHHPDCNGACVAGCPVAEIDQQSGDSQSRIGKPRRSAGPGDGYGMVHTGSEYADSGGASRFYPTFAWEADDFAPFHYFSKASRKDRGEGNVHPTVKPIALMRWLVRLVAPAGGTVLDPFMGSGSTGVACGREGFGFIGIEKDAGYFAVAEQRIRAEAEKYPLLGTA